MCVLIDPFIYLALFGIHYHGICQCVLPGLVCRVLCTCRVGRGSWLYGSPESVALEDDADVVTSLAGGDVGAAVRVLERRLSAALAPLVKDKERKALAPTLQVRCARKRGHAKAT